jgi:phosphocarrier protein HPr
MTEPRHVARRNIGICNLLGLHMRFASKIVELASSFQSEISVSHNGIVANGKSILDLLSLAAECGSVLTLEARGHDAEDAVAALADLFSAQFHEQ